MNDLVWMQQALAIAEAAAAAGEVPVGALCVADGELLASAGNGPIQAHDPTAHAEIKLLQAAGKITNNYRLTGSTLYVTLEPCIMCLGAIMHARISQVIFGAYDPKTGVCGSCEDLTKLNCFNHRIDITGGVLEEESKNLLHSFFKSKR